jgi:spore maturation protein CgeB
MGIYTPRKILVAGPVGGDSFAENIVNTITNMGITAIYDHQLTPGRYHSRWRSMRRKICQKRLWSTISPEECWLIKAAKQYRPDIFIAPTQIIQEETLLELKRQGVRVCVAWWGDPPGYMTEMGLLTDEWNLIYFKDPEVVGKFRAVGLNAYLLHEAMNPAWHKPIAKQTNEDVVVAGNFYGYRQFLVRELLRRDVKLALYGIGLPRWVYPEIRRMHTGRYIVREEKSRIFGEALACLNSTQIIEGNSLNCRAFEIAGAGGLHLMEYKPIISECFEPGKEVLTFDSLDELMGHIERARRVPGEMKKIREAAAHRAHAEHTYRHRLEKIFADLNIA